MITPGEGGCAPCCFGTDLLAKKEEFDCLQGAVPQLADNSVDIQVVEHVLLPIDTAAAEGSGGSGGHQGRGVWFRWVRVCKGGGDQGRGAGARWTIPMPHRRTLL